MSIYPLVGFGANAVAPTRENLANLRSMLALPVEAFVSAYDYFERGNFKNPPPQDGEAKYWNAPHAITSMGLIFARRTEVGGYISRNPVRDAQAMPIHTRLFSQKAWSFFDTRPDVTVPELYSKWISAEEARRLSFPATEIEDPMDIPIAAIQGQEGFPWQVTTFNQDAILFMEYGKPQIASIEAAIKKFPVQWGPTVPGPVAPSVPGGVPADDVLRFARRLIDSSSVRSRVRAILDGPSTSTGARLTAALKVE